MGHRRAADHLPTVAAPFQRQVDGAQMRRAGAAHHRGLSVNRAAQRVDGLVTVETLGREHHVAVAGDQGVDPLDSRQRYGGVFHAASVMRGPDARMTQGQDHVGALGLHPRDLDHRGFDDVAGGHAPVQLVAVPGGDLGRHEADDADAQRMEVAGPVAQVPVEDRIGCQQRFIRPLTPGRPAHHIGRNDREGGACQRVGQEIQPVVEIVVAQGSGVEPQPVHRRDHRVRPPGRDPFFQGHVVAHRCALQEISVVHQQAVVGTGPQGRDQIGGARQAGQVVRPVPIIVVAADVHVHVRGRQDPQADLVQRRMAGKRVQNVQAGSGQRVVSQKAYIPKQVQSRVELPLTAFTRARNCVRQAIKAALRRRGQL